MDFNAPLVGLSYSFDQTIVRPATNIGNQLSVISKEKNDQPPIAEKLKNPNNSYTDYGLLITDYTDN